MSELTVNLTLGYCGKVPSKGDFMQSDFDFDFLNIWNEWQQSVIAVSKEQLEDKWLDCYLTSPIWHFSLSPGICSESAVIGTLIPSVDKVNRHFPFTLFAKHQHTAVQAWYQNSWDIDFESKILEVLEDDFDIETWFRELTDKVEFSDVSDLSITNIESLDSIKKGWVIKGENSPSILHLMHQQYSQHFVDYSIWWTAGSELIEPCVIVTDGLPQVSQFVSMLDGQWTKRDWNICETN